MDRAEDKSKALTPDELAALLEAIRYVLNGGLDPATRAAFASLSVEPAVGRQHWAR